MNKEDKKNLKKLLKIHLGKCDNIFLIVHNYVIGKSTMLPDSPFTFIVGIIDYWRQKPGVFVRPLVNIKTQCLEIYIAGKENNYVESDR